jgi:hypothetical protein
VSSAFFIKGQKVKKSLFIFENRVGMKGWGGVSLDIIYIVIVEGFTLLRTDGWRKIARQKSVKLHFLTEDKVHNLK